MTRARNAGLTLYARALRCIAERSMTALQMSERLSLSPGASHLLLRHLKGRKMAHIAGWTEVGIKNQPTPLYGFGTGNDALPPLTKRRGQPLKSNVAKAGALKPRSGMIAFACIVHELQTDRCTTAMLVERSGVAVDAIDRLLRRMRRLRLIRVAEWERHPGGGSPTPYYEFSVDGTDAKRPKPIARSEIDAKRRANLKARAETIAFVRALAGVGAQPSRLPLEQAA